MVYQQHARGGLAVGMHRHQVSRRRSGAGVVIELDIVSRVQQRPNFVFIRSRLCNTLAAMASGKAPYNAEVAARNADFLDALSQMPWDGFHANTKDEKSRALPAIYDDAAKFKEAQDRFRGAITKLNAAKDEGSFKAAAGEVGKSCGACHESFRAK